MIDKAWRETTRLSRWLAVFALANLMIVTALLIALPSTGWREVAPYDTASFVAFRMSFDSWEPIREAWVYLQDPSDKAVYQAVFFDAGTKFQYALTSLLPYEVVMLVLPGDEQHFWPLDMVSWFAMWATAGLVAMIFLRSLDTYAPEYAPRSTAERLLLGATAAGMTLTFYPLAKAASLGQIQTWINALFAVLVWLWITRRPVHAGIVGGIICAIKPQLGLLLLWGLLRRQWGFSGAFAATLGVIGVVTLGLYGLENNLDYLHVLRYISRHGESYYPNQSINGLLNRLLDNGPNRDFDVYAFPPYDRTVYVGTIASSVFIVGAALFWRAGEHQASSAFDLLIAALSFTIASPVAWEHHYGVLMPMYAMLLPAMLRWPVFGRWSLPVLAASYVLSSNFFDVAQEAADTPLLTPVQSYLLVAAFVVLAALYAVRRREGAGVESAAESAAPAAAVA
ncbi:MAG TPA: glycosyltransferase family 87 protein [Dehalococcoidia bacterium]|nr:glycosyltransferase family 87 protein [Dehalococcoidia bacterium]